MNGNFTVLVPFYNQENYVKEVLDGIFDQSILPRQVIITNDFSQDNTKLNIEKYISNINYDVEILYINNSKNLGLMKSLNNMLSKVTYDIVFFNAGDDISLPNRFEKSIHFLNSYSVDLVFSNAYFIDSKSKSITNRTFLDNNSILDVLSIENNEVIVFNKENTNINTLLTMCLGGFSFCFKKDILSNKFFPEKLPYEDRYLTFLANLRNGSLIIKEPLIKYRRHENNLSQNLTLLENKENKIREFIKILQQENIVCKEQIEYLVNNSFDDKYINIMKKDYYIKKLKIDLCSKSFDFNTLLQIFANPEISIVKKLKSIRDVFFKYRLKNKILKMYNRRYIQFGGKNE